MAKKGITLPNGDRLSHGQLFAKEGNQMQRPFSGINPRQGLPKKTEAQEVIPTVPGQRSRIAPSHEFLHGAPIADEPLEKTYVGKGVPVHDGMSNRSSHDPKLGSAVLKDAANLGRHTPPEKA